MAEVGRVGLADDDAAGGSDAAGDYAVESGDLVLLEDGAAGVAEAGAGFKVFDGDGEAVEGAEILAAHDSVFGGAGGVEGEVGVDGEKGVDGGIEFLDAGEEGLGQLDG